MSANISRRETKTLSSNSEFYCLKLRSTSLTSRHFDRMIKPLNKHDSFDFSRARVTKLSSLVVEQRRHIAQDQVDENSFSPSIFSRLAGSSQTSVNVVKACGFFCFRVVNRVGNTITRLRAGATPRK